nr:copia protein [Tanacetum cinerariifolium]
MGAEADFKNMESSIIFSPIPTHRVHLDHPKDQILLKSLIMQAGLRQCKKSCCNLAYRRKEEGIDYDKVFAPVARIETIRIFLAFASYMGFIVYQMDVKSAFLYGTIEEEVYVCQPPGFIDPQFPNKVYKVLGYTKAYSSSCCEEDI